MTHPNLAVLLAARLLPEVDFLLVGTGELEGLWRKTAQVLRLGNVRFLGRREDMPELYRAADAVLLPTLGENQSLATLEAMASALPVVTTPIPAQEELIQNGVTGLLVPPRPHLLAQALNRLQGEGQALGARARAHVLGHHTLEGSAEALAAALKEAIYA
jgi:glycosyltransferase involved in cell wall biosynthesis